MSYNLQNYTCRTYKTIREVTQRVFLRSTTLLKKSLWHRCFPVNFEKFLRTPFLQSTSGRLLLSHHLKAVKFNQQEAA